MWEVRPKAPPYRIVRSGIPLEIEIRPPRPWYIAVFVGLFTVVWIVGTVAIIYTIIQHRSTLERWGFLALWLLGWLVVGGLNLVISWWMLVGKECLVWNRTGLTRGLYLGPLRPARNQMVTL